MQRHMDPNPSSPQSGLSSSRRKAPPRVSLDLCETPPGNYGARMSVENGEIRSPLAAGAFQVKPKIRPARTRYSLSDLTYAERNMQDVPMSPLVTRGGPVKSLADSGETDVRSPYSRSLSRNRRLSNVPYNASPKNSSRKAVLIHACYINTEGAQRLRSQSNLASMYDLLVLSLGFSRGNVWVLTDEPKTIPGAVNFTPTRGNILNSMRWLVKGSSAKHQLLFCFSGHGCRVLKERNPVAVFEDCILPCDYPMSSPISETEIKQILVQNLRNGATLTSLLDCQNSAQLMNLPYIHAAARGAKGSFFLREEPEAQRFTSASTPGVVLNSVLRFSKLKRGGAEQRRMAAQERRNANAATCFDNGTVICISWSFETESECPSISSSPPNHGCLTHAFVRYLKHSAAEKSKPSYSTALCAMSAWLSSRGGNLPQFSSTHKVSPDKPISLL